MGETMGTPHLKGAQHVAVSFVLMPDRDRFPSKIAQPAGEE